MRLQLMRLPDALHRAQRNACRFGHRAAGPVGRLVRRHGAGQRHHLGRFFGRDRRLARLAGPVAQQTLNPRFGEALLPTPHCRPADTDALGNPLRRSAVGRSQHDPRPLAVLLRPVAVRHSRLQPIPVQIVDNHTYRLSHKASIAQSRSLMNLMNASEH
jgi:hypothetical protein